MYANPNQASAQGQSIRSEALGSSGRQGDIGGEMERLDGSIANARALLSTLVERLAPVRRFPAPMREMASNSIQPQPVEVQPSTPLGASLNTYRAEVDGMAARMREVLADIELP